MLRIAICDDDKILVTQIEEMLNRYLDKKMIDRYIDIFYDGASLERIYEKGDRFDIIYLDIEMSGKNGIEAAKSIRKLDRDVLLIYVSSYETYFMQLFEVEPFRFIKKPIKETEFEEVIDLAYERIIVIFIKCIWGYCKSMKILLISESSTEDDIYCMIDQIIKIDKIIEAHDISEELSYITDIQYDIIIINYDKVRIRHGDFKMIFDIRCKTQAPLLVILEGCEIRDKLHVLNMKADDYIEKPINIDELEEKMLQLLHKLS